MRFKKINPTFTAVAIAAIACSSSYAQLETNAAAVQSPMVIQGSPMIEAPTGNTVMQAAPQFEAPQFSTPMMSSTPTTMSQPIGSSVVTPSNSYGPLVIGKGGNGCSCCDMTPTPTVVPTLEPVTSCCGSLGPLGVPALLTPPRTYRPPVGRQYGRPLFGKWNGY